MTERHTNGHSVTPQQLVRHINLFALTQHNLYECFNCLDEEESKHVHIQMRKDHTW